MKRFLWGFVFLAFILPSLSSAASVRVFGPERITLERRRAKRVFRFEVSEPGRGLIRLVHGRPRRSLRGRVVLNGRSQKIRLKRAFKRGVSVYERKVMLRSKNVLRVRLRGRIGDWLEVEVWRRGHEDPEVSIWAEPEEVVFGEGTSLNWESKGVEGCEIFPDVGPVGHSGSMEVFPERTTEYVLRCSWMGGVEEDRAVVVVMADVERQPEGSFGSRYEELIPPDSQKGSYAPERFSLIRGRVSEVGGGPLEGVEVKILEDPSYGTAVTDEGGWFSIPVEGGSHWTLVFIKEGYLEVHRKVYVEWNDIAHLGEVELAAEDPEVTHFVLDGDGSRVVAHRSTEVADVRGVRAATVVLRGDNMAWELDGRGSVVEQLRELDLRATEYRTAESMPAVLPSTSGYTYCIELGVDGAEGVRFDRPVVLWVENFLGFDVGEVVPVGRYDRAKGQWVPEENGLVVMLLDTDGDGAVDALDATGDGIGDDLDGDGSLSDEVEGLWDPSLYPPGGSFWRVEVRHFSPLDLNWPIGPPEDAIPPNGRGRPWTWMEVGKRGDCLTNVGSYVTHRGGVLHEDVKIAGSAYKLHYSSFRAMDYKYRVIVPVSGPEVPSSLKRIIVRMDVAGRRFERVFDPVPDLIAEFEWDGLDFMGRPSGTSNAHIQVGFVYDAVYYMAGGEVEAFARAGIRPTGIIARQELISWRSWDVPLLGKLYPGGMPLGWSLSVQHRIDPSDPSTLYKGDGTVFRNDVNVIYTAAGGGFEGFWGDGGRAQDAWLNNPMGVAADPHGGFYIADTYNRRVRKVSPEGVISTVAGGGSKTSDGIPATDASIYLVWDVSVDIHGNLYIAEGNRIRKVTPDGVIHTVVGSGRGGYCGDDGPAAGACLADPQGIFVDREGFIYIADTFNHRVRMVTPDGMIYTVAGTGQEGFFGDGGPATGARLDHPSGVCVDRWGNIYIADRDNHRIRKVSPDGVITTYAGTGSPGIESEGGPAREAQLDSPVDVAVDSQGDLYIANRGDYQEKRHFYVRVVRSDGTMETLAGTSDGWGYNGDGLPAKEAFLYWPSGLDVGPGGRLYVADTYNNRIRRVTLGGSSLRSQQGLVFAEEGLLHLFEGSGRHLQSQDLYSGSVLLEFHYDDEGLLSSITDPNGNETLIMRDARGYPQTIVSPDGLETQLVVDDGGRLLRVIQPDGAVHSFQYNEGGLLTSVKKPNGSLYEFQYDRWGHLTDAMDEEGGHWSYSFSPVLETGGGLFEVKSSEGQLLSYLDSWGTDGSYESVITSPWGDETDFLLKSNRLEGQKYLPCGKRIEFTFGFDPVLSFRYPKELKEGTSSGLVRRWRLKRHYQDQDGDSELDLVVKELTLNSRPYILGRNLLSSRWSITAPESRVISGSYDPTNLKVTSIEVPGLHPIELGYDSRGRLISLRMAQRSATFSYDHQGYLSALTDSLGFTTSMENDPMGRPIKVRRPDGSLIIFSYDGNGNLTVIETPSGAIHAFTYSRVDLPVSYRPPISPAYVYLFDRDRRLEGILLPSGRGISLNYTSGRLTSIETPEGEIRLGYLCGSRPSFLSRGTEGIRWEYDGPLVVSEETFGTLRGSIS